LPRLASGLDLWLDLRDPQLEIAGRLGVRQSTLARVLAARAQLAKWASEQTELARHLRARLAIAGEVGYPASLLDLHDPPIVLASRGAPPQDLPSVAIVGARRADLYGREVAHFFGSQLAASGAVVVSGLARGVDGAAHQGALDGRGQTVAVFGCGLARCYPTSHRDLAEAIVANSGSLVSELPLDAAPLAHHFPIRNRLIAALAGAVVVVQATARSGSLVTARLALEIGREVLAVPGGIFDELALGPNALLRDGARPALHPADILACVGLDGSLGATTSTPTASAGEPPDSPGRQLLALLPATSGVAAERLAAAGSLALDQVLATLLELELAGHARCNTVGLWTRTR
jgi:DNA processing protein